MSIRRNDPCPCQSGRKLKRCCLEEHLAWDRAGNGFMVAYVQRPSGARYPIADWGARVGENTDLILQFNPVTSAWAHRALPDVDDFATVAYRDQLLEHVLRLSDGQLSVEMAERLTDELCLSREFLMYEFVLAPAV
jgi:hypothetical protein